MYNARANVTEYQRLTFVLLGVATPSDLMSDPHRTPFNIGQRVDLTDFTLDQAMPLAEGLGLEQNQARQSLDWVLKWTSGHPYLTQRLCRAIAEQFKSELCEEDVDLAAANTFFGKMSEEDNNLQFVRDMLTKWAPDRLKVLTTYREIRLGRHPVSDEEQSPTKNHLKLSGIVRRDNGALKVRNAIYENVFERKWLKTHWPTNWLSTVPRSVKIASVLSMILLIISISLAVFAFNIAEQNRQAEKALARTALLGHIGPVNSLVFSADGKKLVSGSSDKSIRVWDLSDPDRDPVTLQDHQSWVWSVALSPESDTVISGGADKTIRVWNVSTKNLAEKVCASAGRNLSRAEWDEFIGEDLEYVRTCPNLPPGKGIQSKTSNSSH